MLMNYPFSSRKSQDRANLNETYCAWPSSLLTTQGRHSHWAERKSCLRSGANSSPSISSTTAYQGDSFQHILRKGITGIHLKSSSPSKAGTNHTQCAEGCSHIKTAISRLQWTTVSPKAIETEKAK